MLILLQKLFEYSFKLQVHVRENLIKLCNNKRNDIDIYNCKVILINWHDQQFFQCLIEKFIFEEKNQYTV